MAGLDRGRLPDQGRRGALKLLRHPALRWLLAVVVGGVFVYASLDKIAHPREFAGIVYHYRLAGPTPRMGFVPANVLAVTLPWVEALAGALLIVGVWRRAAALVVVVLLLTFLAAVGYALSHGLDVESCGCFSVTGEGRRLGVALIAGDLALLGASLLLAFVPPQATRPAGGRAPAAASSS